MEHPQKPIKNERDKQTDVQAKLREVEPRLKIHPLEYVIAATQILTVMCLIKGNPAWKGSLSLLFFGAAFGLFYKYRQYTEKPYLQVGVVLLLIGIALLVWFGITG